MPRRSLLVACRLLVVLAALSAGGALAVGIEAPWARPTPPGASVGGAYLTLVGGAQADRVLSASSPAAAAVELHRHHLDAGVAKMRALAAIDVPAGGRVELQPGGLHLMLIGLKAPLQVGQQLSVELRFEKAGLRRLLVPVRAQPPAAQPAEAHASH